MGLQVRLPSHKDIPGVRSLLSWRGFVASCCNLIPPNFPRILGIPLCFSGVQAASEGFSTPQKLEWASARSPDPLVMKTRGPSTLPLGTPLYYRAPLIYGCTGSYYRHSLPVLCIPWCRFRGCLSRPSRPFHGFGSQKGRTLEHPGCSAVASGFARRTLPEGENLPLSGDL